MTDPRAKKAERGHGEATIYTVFFWRRLLFFLATKGRHMRHHMRTFFIGGVMRLCDTLVLLVYLTPLFFSSSFPLLVAVYIII